MLAQTLAKSKENRCFSAEQIAVIKQRQLLVYSLIYPLDYTGPGAVALISRLLRLLADYAGGKLGASTISRCITRKRTAGVPRGRSAEREASRRLQVARSSTLVHAKSRDASRRHRRAFRRRPMLVVRRLQRRSWLPEARYHTGSRLLALALVES